MTPKKDKPTGALSDNEITDALRLSGFPLEIRLLQQFDAAGFDPIVGFRLMLDEAGKSVEVDVMAYATASLADYKGQIYLKAMIEAKQLVDRRVFVGMKWKQPTAHEMRSLRIRLSGRPTCQVLSDGPGGQDLIQLMLGGAEPVAAAIDSLNEGIVCSNWAYVQDSKQFGVMALQDTEHRDSFAKLIRVVTALEEDTANHLTRTPGKPPMLQLQILSPTIVLGTPHLYVFDPLTEQLERTPRLILQQMFEAGGRVHARLVDVVTETGLPDFIDRYRRVVAALKTACDKRVDLLQQIAGVQGDEVAQRSERDEASRLAREGQIPTIAVVQQSVGNDGPRLNIGFALANAGPLAAVNVRWRQINETESSWRAVGMMPPNTQSNPHSITFQQPTTEPHRTKILIEFDTATGHRILDTHAVECTAQRIVTIQREERRRLAVS